ncbi:Pre-mRNA-splicing factor ATP-dependent RNA helicase PRP43, partial [Phytophthora palmivora]
MTDRKRKVDIGDLDGKKKKRKSRFSDVPPTSADGGVNPLTGAPFSARYQTLLAQRQKLPVHQFLEQIQDAVKQHQVIVVEGETGSGKTTQIPQFLTLLNAASDKMVACTQPRRVAAMSIAKRVAEEMDVQLGQEVGYT